MAENIQSLADTMQKEAVQAASMGTLPFCVPYAERFLPSLTRAFRVLLRIHAAGLRHLVDNASRLDAKDRAYHLSDESYLLPHSCHWSCKSRAVSAASRMLRPKCKHQKTLCSASAGWKRGG